MDLQEPTLGLRWDCLRDSLKYKHRPVVKTEPTLRNVYKVLACQYDPLGCIVPFTTRAKILVQDLWKEHIGWDEPIQPQSLCDRWLNWEREIPDLIQMEIPRCYAPASADSPASTRDLHIFCDASERAYGSVAYLRTEDAQNEVHVSFVLARSRVAPKKQLSMPRLELSAALTSQCSPHRAHLTHQEDHTLVRLYYSSTLDQVGILSLQGLRGYTCGGDTEPYGGQQLEVRGQCEQPG